MTAPKWAAALLRRVAPPDRADDVLGDLEEAHSKRVQRCGRTIGNLLTAVEALDVALSLMRERVRRRRAARRPSASSAEPRRGSWTSLVSWLDFKLGFRMLVKYPGLTLVGGFAMAVGIAIAAGSFEFFNDFINPTLPLEQGDRVVAIQNWDASASSNEFRSLHDFVTWRDELESVADIGAYTTFRRNVITEDGRAEPVRGSEISASAFRLARVPPLLGRPLVEADEQEAAPPVVVIGHDLWQARFGGDSGIVGRSVQLGSSRATVVGVMPEGFGFPLRDNLWVPLRVNVLDYERLEGPTIRIFGRLAPGITLKEAQSELTAIGLRAAAAFPETNEKLRPRILPYAQSFFTGDVLAVSGVQYFLVIILIVACVNVATLVFARTATREGEIAVRNALGASRGRIIMQLFVEVLVLASVAAVVGLAVASWGLRRGVTLLIDTQGPLSFWWNESLAPATILYVAILAVLSAAIAGVIPALKVTGRRAQEGLRHVATGSSGLRFGGLSTTVIVTQVAVSVALLTFALGEGWVALRAQSAEVSFPAEEYLSVRLQMDRETPSSARAETYEAEFAARYNDVYQEVARRVGAETGISAVTFADIVPGMSQPRSYVDVDGVAPPRGSAIGHVVRDARIDVGFFDALDTPILLGSGFSSGDLESDRDVVIVNQSFVNQLLADEKPIGRRVRYATPPDEEPGPWYEIVGVVGDLGMNPENPAQAAGLYHPVAPADAYPVRMVVRVRQDPQALALRLRRIATAVDPTMRLDELLALDEVIRREQLAMRFGALALFLVAAMVLALATAGTYALMSFIVSQRTREIGIRTALGANPQSIVASIFSRGLAQLALGVALGIAGLVVLEGREGGIEAPGVLLAVPALMMVVGLSACGVPARRALRIQPTEALREG